MKRLLTALFVIFGILEGTYALAVYQPTNLGYVTLQISSGTLNDIINSTAPTATQRYCTDCKANGNAGTVCTSTSTASPTWGQFILSTGTRCQ